jgi:hypothetical protein
VQAFQREGSETQRLFGQAYSLFGKSTSAAALSWSNYFQWGSALRALARRMNPAHSRNSLQVLREAILRLEQSIRANPMFYGSRMESVLCILDAITHPGRDLSALASKRDTEQFFHLGALHFSSAIQVERRLRAEKDEITQNSVERFKQGT